MELLIIVLLVVALSILSAQSLDRARKRARERRAAQLPHDENPE